jgi:hypothetical protein
MSGIPITHCDAQNTEWWLWLAAFVVLSLFKFLFDAHHTIWCQKVKHNMSSCCMYGDECQLELAIVSKFYVFVKLRKQTWVSSNLQLAM